MIRQIGRILLRTGAGAVLHIFFYGYGVLFAWYTDHPQIIQAAETIYDRPVAEVIPELRLVGYVLLSLGILTDLYFVLVGIPAELEQCSEKPAGRSE